MYATMRRYDGVDTDRTDELTRKVSESLVPELRKIEGFRGYYLVDLENGVFSSFGLFEGPKQAEEATEIAASWVKTEKLESALPNAPRISNGKVIAHENGVTVA
jgi:hypothetical protein